MVAIITRIVFSIKDDDTKLAVSVLDELHAESRIRVDKIGPGQLNFIRYIKKHSIKRFPVIIITNPESGIEMKIEGEDNFTSREKLRKVLSNIFMKLVYVKPRGGASADP